MTRNEWITEKIRMSEDFAKGACGASYSEAMLVLCSAISSFAAEVWPGDRIDQKRFVEILKTYTPAHLNARTISIPLLVGTLRAKRMTNEEQAVKEGFLSADPSQILIGSEIDKTEEEILADCNTVALDVLRKCSYANLLYCEVRCGYVHEYRPGTRAENWPMTSDLDAPVSYVNRLESTDRHIHFQINWVSSLAIAVASAVDNIENAIPLDRPKKWWIES
jgi:hypothetical protein